MLWRMWHAMVVNPDAFYVRLVCPNGEQKIVSVSAGDKLLFFEQQVNEGVLASAQQSFAGVPFAEHLLHDEFAHAAQRELEDWVNRRVVRGYRRCFFTVGALTHPFSVADTIGDAIAHAYAAAHREVPDQSIEAFLRNVRVHAYTVQTCATPRRLPQLGALPRALSAVAERVRRGRPLGLPPGDLKQWCGAPCARDPMMMAFVRIVAPVVDPNEIGDFIKLQLTSPRSDCVLFDRRLAEPLLLAKGAALFKLFGHGVAPYGVGDTGDFLSDIWEALALHKPSLFRGDRQTLQLKEPPRKFASLLGALFATVVARRLPLTASTFRLAPDFFATLENHGEFTVRFIRAFSNIIPWEWFILLSEADRFNLLFQSSDPVE
jgi:hypothetical protein